MLVMSVALFRLKYRVDPVSKSLHQDLKLIEGELAFEHKTRPLRATFGRRDNLIISLTILRRPTLSSALPLVAFMT